MQGFIGLKIGCNFFIQAGSEKHLADAGAKRFPRYRHTHINGV
jgi:hypothetical protein